MGINSSLYNVVLLLHLIAVIVGFGSSFVGSFAAARARGMAPRERYAVEHVAFLAGKALTSPPVVASGLLGVILVVLSDEAWKFSQPWISLAFLLYFAVVGIGGFLLTPNAKAMDELGARLAEVPVGGIPPEVAELDARAKKAAAFTGVIHLLWLLLLIDMVWKPGS
jgi:hypothetical protein